MRPRNLPQLIAGGLVGLGILLRLRAYLAGRPLWLDEAMVGLNIVARPMRELAKPLWFDQSAPLLFLWVERLISLTAGVSQYALRALPLLAGLLVSVVIWRLGTRLLSPIGVALAIGITAVSPGLLYHANELKPYGLDAVLSATVVLMTLRVLEAPGSAWRWLWIVGTIALFASAPAFLVAAGVVPALLLRRPGPAEPSIRVRAIVMGITWMAVFGVLYAVVYRSAATNGYMQIFWRRYFLDPRAPGFAGTLVLTLGSSLREFFLGNGGSWRDSAALLFLVPAAIGAARLARTRGLPTSALMVLPIVAAFGASAIHRYPIAPRLMLYSAPLWILLIVAGLEEVADRLRAPWLVAVTGVALLLLPIRAAAAEFLVPSRPHDLPPLVEFFRRKHESNDAIYLFARAVPPWVFYTTDWRSPDLERVARLSGLNSFQGAAFRNRGSRYGPVVNEGDSLVYRSKDWIELIGVPTGQGPDSVSSGAERPDSGWADNEARRLAAANRPGVWVLLNSFRPMVPGLLTAAIEARGGVLIERQVASQAMLLHFRMTGDTSQGRSGAPGTETKP